MLVLFSAHHYAVTGVSSAGVRDEGFVVMAITPMTVLASAIDGTTESARERRGWGNDQ